LIWIPQVTPEWREYLRFSGLLARYTRVKRDAILVGANTTFDEVAASNFFPLFKADRTPSEAWDFSAKSSRADRYASR
jgi:hypothetical protein